MGQREQQALERTYTGTMRVYGFKAMEMPWGETRQEKQLLMANVKCALSQIKLGSSYQEDNHQGVNYQAKLFLAPDVQIPSGSEVLVSQDGMTYGFIHSGEAFRYPSHQEIMIERIAYV